MENLIEVYENALPDNICDEMVKTFKENMYSQTAKNKIDREKKRDAQKHDRMMDLARLRDASAKNKQTTVKR